MSHCSHGILRLAIRQDGVFEQFRLKSEGYLGVEQQTSIHLSEVSEETLPVVEKLYKQTGANVLHDKKGKLQKLTSLQAMTQKIEVITE